MEPFRSVGNISRWHNTRRDLLNLARWALNCPELKPKSSSFFFSISSTQKEQFSISRTVIAISEDSFAVLFTCLVAYFLQCLINYFVHFCASLGYILSGANSREPPSASSSLPKALSVATTVPVETSSPPLIPVKVNEPVNCPVRLTNLPRQSSQLNPRPHSVSESNSSDRDCQKNSDYKIVLDEDRPIGKIDDNQSSEAMVSIYGGDALFSGVFDISIDGLVEFIWLDNNYDKVSLTGSFLGFSLSMPLVPKDGAFRLTLKLPAGVHQFQFIPS